jgi:LPPG:FO 2-phospho-L-lactate transferase
MPEVPSVAVLCGGFGAARFVPALAGIGLELCCIVNTVDDLDHLGVHISPDIDSVCYALAGRFDEGRGWGLVGDTFRCVDALDRYGEGRNSASTLGGFTSLPGGASRSFR